MPDHPLFRFGPPPDGAAWGALAVGLLVLGAARFLRWAPEHKELWLRRRPLGAAALAALLSTLYFQYYLEGAPRVIDATAYLLEGRLLAQGDFSFVPPEPSALFRGRFLLHPPDDPLRLGVLFPPGYPLLLALAELTFDYRMLGPALAAALVLATAALAFEATRSRQVAFWAALFSATCACLRYHTADTMSHGASALEATLLVLFTLRLARRLRAEEDTGAPAWAARDVPRPFLEALGFGAAGGLLCATRELTGLVFVVVCGLFLVMHTARRGSFEPSHLGADSRPSLHAILTLLGSALLGAAPFLALSLLHHQELTGSFFGSPQLRYYELSDGPPGCFGLGSGTGCAFEHADVVQAHGGGLTPFWALRHTLNRLHAHTLDLAQLEPLALLALFWMVKNRRAPSGALFLALLLALPLAYAFFYFDGSYPGGGARFLAELLPLEQVALAAFLVERGRQRWGFGFALVGFALHASYSHAHLRDHIPGAPPARVFAAADGVATQRAEATGNTHSSNSQLSRRATPNAAARERARLVFVEGDHAFLAHFDPRALPNEAGGPLRGLLVARRSHDVRELWLYEHLGAPPTFVLEHDRLVPWEPPLRAERAPPAPAGTPPAPAETSATPSGMSAALATEGDAASTPRFTLEAEVDWPPLAVEGAWAHPSHPPGSCVSRGRALAFEAIGPAPSREGGRHDHPDTLAERTAASNSLTAATSSLSAAPSSPTAAPSPTAASSRVFVFDAGGVPPGDYELDAVFWTPSRSCWTAPVGRFQLPARIPIPLPSTPGETLHLDRVELR